jgi:putative ABC transport system permease protein
VPINLSNKQIRVYPDPSAAPDFTPHTTAGDSRRRAAQVNRLASALRPAAIIPLATVAERGAKPELRDTTEGSPSLVATREAGGSYRLAAFLYVATPQLLRSLGIDPTAIRRDTDFIASTTEETRNLLIPSTTTRRVFPITNLQRLAMPRLLLGAPTLETGLQPPILITVNGLRRHGWHQLANGWLVQARTPLTSRKIALARGVAADSGLAIETRRAPDTYAAIRFGTIAAGALLALSILAMTVGLIRSEAAGDLLTLTATGATSRIRRSLTATTAGSLALLGCLLAIPGAYLTLTALYAGDLHNLGRVPLAQLAIIAAGVPTLAGLGGWILAARQPQAARAARQL